MLWQKQSEQQTPTYNLHFRRNHMWQGNKRYYWTYAIPGLFLSTIDTLYVFPPQPGIRLAQENKISDVCRASFVQQQHCVPLTSAASRVSASSAQAIILADARCCCLLRSFRGGLQGPQWVHNLKVCVLEALDCFVARHVDVRIVHRVEVGVVVPRAPSDLGREHYEGQERDQSDQEEDHGPPGEDARLVAPAQHPGPAIERMLARRDRTFNIKWLEMLCYTSQAWPHQQQCAFCAWREVRTKFDEKRVFEFSCNFLQNDEHFCSQVWIFVHQRPQTRSGRF